MSTTTDSLGWTPAMWDTIKQAVKDESQRTKIVQKIVPVTPLTGVANVSTDRIDMDNNILTIPEGASTTFIETTVQFALTKTQLQQEEQISTAITLARRAANLISRAQDEIIFRGIDEFRQHGQQRNLTRYVRITNGNGWPGLLGDNPARVRRRQQQQPQQPLNGELIFTEVTQAIAQLQGIGQFGPYALVLPTTVYAETYAPVNNIIYADLIKPLAEKGFFGTGGLPQNRGIMLSLGGDSMDLSVAADTTPEFLSVNDAGVYNFRLFERFILRLKDPGAVIALSFD